ncbi:MAG: hypothetical protein SFV21_12515, partial [Rhodospirillaceae bacterium]|nr:hypothetical protein [Rhodospirillaceae bacterium]
AVSRDGGATFEAPVRIKPEHGIIRTIASNRPRIVGAANGTWHVLYTAIDDHPTLGKPALTTHYTRSPDGRVFEPPRRLPALTDADMTGRIHGGYMSAATFGTLAVAANGAVSVFWIDSRDMGADTDARALYVRTSRDDGANFDAERELIPTDVCPCCQMMAGAGGDEVLLSVRMVMPDGARPSMLMRIAADGTIIQPPVDTGGARWELDGCPQKATAVVQHGPDVFAAVYNGAGEPPGVYLSRSTDRGRSFAPAAAVHPEAQVSDAPSLAVNGRFVLAAWHGKTDGPRRVFTRMYDLDGRPAGPVTALTDGPDNAQMPVVAARPDGGFHVAWLQAGRIFAAALPADRGAVSLGAR